MAEVNTGTATFATRRIPTDLDDTPGQANSAVSWAAILAGAVGAAALSLLLLILGTGFGFSAVSPWSTEGITAGTFGIAAILWLSFTQLAASGMGGYLAGRLRSRWTAVHSDEVYFRDTAHGFLTWAVASLLTLLLLGSVLGSLIGSGISAGASAAGNVAGSAATMTAAATDSDEASDTIEYYVDSLFRGDSAAGQQDGEMAGIPIGEVARIFTQALRTGSLPQEDEAYIGQLIAQRTDMSQQQAEQRVSEGFERAQTSLDEAATMVREVADEAREASAYAALWMFVALLLGAFVASLMAVFGGRQRDA